MQYEICGLTMYIDANLPFLVPADGLPDVVIQIEEVSKLPEIGSHFDLVGEEVHQLSMISHAYLTPDGSCVMLRCEDEIVCYVTRDLVVIYYTNLVPREQVYQLVLGDVSVVLLHIRDCQALHGAVLRIQDRTVCILGESGAGKSTLVAYMVSQGAIFLSDDVVPLDGKSVWGSFPALKLEPESAQRLVPVQSVTGPVIPGFSKLRISVKPWGTYDASVTQLDAIYVLGLPTGEGDGPPKIEVLTGKTAFMELLKHTIAGFALPRDRWVAITRDYSRLISEIPIIRIEWSRSWDGLSDLARILSTEQVHLDQAVL